MYYPYQIQVLLKRITISVNFGTPSKCALQWKWCNNGIHTAFPAKQQRDNIEIGYGFSLEGPQL